MGTKNQNLVDLNRLKGEDNSQLEEWNKLFDYKHLQDAKIKNNTASSLVSKIYQALSTLRTSIWVIIDAYIYSIIPSIIDGD